MSLKKYNDALDLKKKFPGYFDVRVFRLAIVAILLLHAVAFVLNDLQLNALENYCPDDSPHPCRNLWFNCTRDYMPWEEKSCVDWLDEQQCERLSCHQQTLQPGEGHRLHPLVRWVNWISFTLFALAFLVNHVRWKKKRWF